MGTRTIALSYDANNRLSSHTDTAGSPRSLTYDARGNVTALGALGFVYDMSDQPRTVSGTATGTYAYDGHMRRVKQVVGGVTRYSVYDAGGGLVEIDEVSGPKTDYIRVSTQRKTAQAIRSKIGYECEHGRRDQTLDSEA